MVGYGAMSFFLIFVGLICLGPLIASKHGHSMWLGLATGLVAFIAVTTAWMAILMFRDALDKKRYPYREDMRVRGKMIVIALLLASTAGTLVLYHRITG